MVLGCLCSQDVQVNNKTKKLLMKENLQLLGEITTKLARTASTQGIETGALNM